MKTLLLIFALAALGGCNSARTQPSNGTNIPAAVPAPQQKASDVTAVSPTPRPARVNVEDEVRRIVGQVLGTDPREVKMDAPLSKQKVAADELDVVEVVMGIEESFDIEIKDEELGIGGDLGGVTEIRPKQLIALVKKKKAK